MAGRIRVPWRDRNTSCVGTTKDGHKCGRIGRKAADGRHWCHVHLVQLLSQNIKQETRE